MRCQKLADSGEGHRSGFAYRMPSSREGGGIMNKSLSDISTVVAATLVNKT
jgi:hypothetical protein